MGCLEYEIIFQENYSNITIVHLSFKIPGFRIVSSGNKPLEGQEINGLTTYLMAAFIPINNIASSPLIFMLEKQK